MFIYVFPQKRDYLGILDFDKLKKVELKCSYLNLFCSVMHSTPSFIPDEFCYFFPPLSPLQFSPDRFHSALEGMDLIALWGLVGGAGLGCLISVPCRDWFNAL